MDVVETVITEMGIDRLKTKDSGMVLAREYHNLNKAVVCLHAGTDPRFAHLWEIPGFTWQLWNRNEYLALLKKDGRTKMSFDGLIPLDAKYLEVMGRFMSS